MKHYHALAGMHGYLPNYSEVHTAYEDAVEDLASLHELGRDRRRRLKKDAYLELNLRRDGNEYTEVSECSEEDCMKGGE